MTNTPNSSDTALIPFSQLLADYADPVNQLITFSALYNMAPDWPDYPAQFALNASHSPDLVRMALDPRFDQKRDDWPDDKPYWAPNHAVRALGQLQSVESAPSLLSLLGKDDDWMMADLPKALAMMGPNILPVLTEFLKDPHQNERAREGVPETLEKLVERYPESRSTCLDILVTLFKDYPQNSPDWNGALLSSLMTLNATEAAELIQEAFKADCITEDICGDWLTVKQSLGLPLTEQERQEWTYRETQISRRISQLERSFRLADAEARNQQLMRQKEKGKRKAAKTARRQNRKK